MKKLLLICALVTCGLSQAYAQLDEDDYGFFNHAAIGDLYKRRLITIEDEGIRLVK